MAKPEIIVEIKTYADGVLVDQTAKIIEPHAWDACINQTLEEF